jgi:hypothetical protein
VLLRTLRLAPVIGVVLLLAACSSSEKSNRKSYNTNGLVPPSAFCAANPARFGDARKISDIDKGNGCFVHNAYQVSSLSGVRFNQPATFNCGIANVTAQWLENSVQPAAEDAFGERVVKIDVPSSYACRPRNNKFGAKLSEHGMGNAIDISAFTLESGRRVEVEQGWFSYREKSFLQQVRADACGPFKTVLGPGSDRYHDDHFHFDLQRHRSGGAYCR